MPVHFYGFLPQNPHLFPFDPIPRVISAEDFSYLERGLKQRVDALNLFLSDVYGAKNIIKDGVVPEDFVYSSSGYLPDRQNRTGMDCSMPSPLFMYAVKELYVGFI